MSATTTEGTAAVLANRYDVVLVFDVQDGNPNGDPDADNAPRMNDQSQRGEVSNVCINRKLRNRVMLEKGGEAPYAIYVTDGAILSDKKRAAYEELGLQIETVEVQNDRKPSKDNAKPQAKAKTKIKRSGDTIEKVRQFMCRNYWDIRTFGAVMNTEVPAGTVRGPFQTTFARSVHPITPRDHTITRCADEKLAERKAGDNRTMGRRYTVPYGCYVGHAFLSPHDAAKTGFSLGDLDLLKASLNMMFESDRASNRGLMTMRSIYAFKHDNMLGRAQAGRLFERVSVRAKGDVPQDFGDIEVTVNDTGLPEGVTLENWLV